MHFGIIVFPGSNCDRDCAHVVTGVMGHTSTLVWHEQTDLSPFDVIILPGGFAHGDYLRTGAIARFSPVMDSVAQFAGMGKPVIGICNGFQILCEAGLLRACCGATQRSISSAAWMRACASSTNENQFPAGDRHRRRADDAGAPRRGQLLRRMRVLWPRWKQTTRSCCATVMRVATSARSEPQRQPRQHRGRDERRRQRVRPDAAPRAAAEKILGSDDGLYIFLLLWRR
jgi:hypothetical protein